MTVERVESIPEHTIMTGDIGSAVVAERDWGRCAVVRRTGVVHDRVRIVNNVVHTAGAVMIDAGQGQVWRKEKAPRARRNPDSLRKSRSITAFTRQSPRTGFFQAQGWSKTS